MRGNSRKTSKLAADKRRQTNVISVCVPLEVTSLSLSSPRSDLRMIFYGLIYVMHSFMCRSLDSKCFKLVTEALLWNSYL